MIIDSYVIKMVEEEKKKYTGSLELNWINKDKSLYYEYNDEGVADKPIWVEKKDIRVSEPRVLKLIEEFGDTSKLKSLIDNALIKGDNLLVLKTLVEEFKNKSEKDKVKCVYIDPPYNTGSAFEHYDDNLEHSEWLSMMKDRLILIKKLMREDGILCMQLNDKEVHYGKVLLDEIFGRDNFLTIIYIQTVYPDKTLKQDRVFHDLIEQVLVYRKSNKAEVNLEYSDYSYDKFNWYINELKEPIKTITLGGKKVEIFQNGTYKIEKKDPTENGLKEVWASGTILDINSSGRFFRDYLTDRRIEDGLSILYKVYEIGDDKFDFRYFTGPKRETATKGKYYQGIPNNKLENKSQVKKKKSIENYWDMAGNFGNCRNEGGVELKSGKKPEKLLYNILKYFSNENDLILDCFLGSASTIASAHKMKRKWIGIEIGKQAEDLCLKRLKNVINGDKTGISKDVDWTGGGGFRYYQLGESLIKDNDMNWDLTYEEISKALFFTFDFSFDNKINENTYCGHNEKATALCIVSKQLNILTKNQIEDIISKIKSKREKLVIYTNNGIAIKSNDLDDSIVIKKIPESILRKYKL